jgi:16S rRNA processing protein RimM
VDFLVIGKIVKAQGIKGEVKLVPITDDVSRFNALKKVFIDGYGTINVETVRIDVDVVYVKFEGINTRNDAEALKDKFVSVERAEAVPLPEGRYYIVDLIGSTIVCGKETVGTLTDVLQNGRAADVYVVAAKGGKTVMFPIVAGVLQSVDLERKRIIVNEKRFSEVAVYD